MSGRWSVQTTGAFAADDTFDPPEIPSDARWRTNGNEKERLEREPVVQLPVAPQAAVFTECRQWEVVEVLHLPRVEVQDLSVVRPVADDSAT